MRNHRNQNIRLIQPGSSDLLEFRSWFVAEPGSGQALSPGSRASHLPDAFGTTLRGRYDGMRPEFVCFI